MNKVADLVTDEMRHKAVDRFRTDPLLEDLLPIEYRPMVADSLLAAVAADLDRGGYDRARRDCADELRATMDAAARPDYDGASVWLLPDPLFALARRWSSGGQTEQERNNTPDYPA